MDAHFFILLGMLAATVIFAVYCLRLKSLHLLHKLYLALLLCHAEWVIPLIIMYFVPATDKTALWVLDAFTTPGGSAVPPLYLCIAITYVLKLKKMDGRMWLLFIIPMITTMLYFTNPLHNLIYKVFDTQRTAIVFGPYISISGIYSYLCLIASTLLLVIFAILSRSKLVAKQCALLGIGGLCPMVVNLIATIGTIPLPITATPISFIVPIIFNGIAIYQLHLVDVQPIAIQHLIEKMSDCYLVLSESALVINYNKSFYEIFGKTLGIRENMFLKDCCKEEILSGNTPVSNMLSAVSNCRITNSRFTYEQTLTIEKDENLKRLYFVTDVSPLFIRENLSGFLLIFKDITQLRESMHKLQESRDRMMEQERLAFLGQMIGGLAHNLKTPIMSISGSVSALEALIEECEESLSDPDVTEEDYREIYSEARDWFFKIRECSSYMSEIITAIKGQAATAVSEDDSVFTIEELLKRCSLLMRHELLQGSCSLKTVYDESKIISLNGDINNLIQVINNLLSNAVYAQKLTGGGEITVSIKEDTGGNLNIEIADTGPGVSPRVRKRLFHSMVTSKGNQGTGLGLYISNAVVRGKFGGTLWVKDNPQGGAIFGISIPKARVIITENILRKGDVDT